MKSHFTPCHFYELGRLVCSHPANERRFYAPSPEMSYGLKIGRRNPQVRWRLLLVRRGERNSVWGRKSSWITFVSGDTATTQNKQVGGVRRTADDLTGHINALLQWWTFGLEWTARWNVCLSVKRQRRVASPFSQQAVILTTFTFASLFTFFLMFPPPSEHNAGWSFDHVTQNVSNGKA